MKKLMLLFFIVVLGYYFLKKNLDSAPIAQPPIQKQAQPKPQVLVPQTKEAVLIENKKNIPQKKLVIIDEVKLKPKLPPKKINPNKLPVAQLKLPQKKLWAQIKDGYIVAAGDMLLAKAPKGMSGYMEFEPPEAIELWPSFQIPFGVEQSLPKSLVKKIETAVLEINQLTQLNLYLITHPSQAKDAVIFKYKNNTCSSFVGKIGGWQPIFIGSGCSKSSIIHEILHAVGFIHEHQRVDRDDHIIVHWENIQKDMLFNFTKLPESWLPQSWADYWDFAYNSVMNYEPKAFSKNKQFTLESKLSTEIQRTTTLSQQDIYRINELYPN